MVTEYDIEDNENKLAEVMKADLNSLIENKQDDDRTVSENAT
jgi:hypothetical protein